MTRPDARQFHVALTGKRLAPCTDEELLARLKKRFKLSDAQGAATLKGACVVKRGVDGASARKLVAVLSELGLEAIARCRAIGVSPPAEIRLSWNANASVHFSSGWSVFTGQKVLTIGMSLIGGLTARQFVGVLAHEFGHFAQRFGMACSFLVNSVNRWLEHCAYGEDAWSTKLHEWSDTADEKEGWFSSLIGLSSLAALVAIALTRRLMGLLFHVSLGLSRYMSRQMEFDADRYEALLAGSDAFRSTARSLRALNHAFVDVNQANIEAWQEHRLLRNLPEAVAAHASEFNSTRLTKIEHEMRERTTTRYWDSHPPDVERIENAEKRRAPGIYMDEAPAALLFKDFSGWAQRVTRQFYGEQGVKFTEDQLRSREEILGHVRGRGQQREQVDRFFNGQFQGWPLLQLAASKRQLEGLPPARAGVAPTKGELGWQESINAIRARSPEIGRHWLQEFQAHERRRVLRAAVQLGVTSRQVGLPGPDRSPEELEAELQEISAHRMASRKPLEEGFALYALRIEHALQSMPESERGHATRMRDTLAAMGALGPEVGALEEFGGAMSAFGSIAQASGEMPAGFDKLETTFGELAAQVLARADRISQSVTADGTVGAYLRACCPEVPAPGKDVVPSVMARAAWRVPTAFHHLYMLALGELVDLCERAEKARGIRPIRLVA